jgi:hypothetical protein
MIGAQAVEGISGDDLATSQPIPGELFDGGERSQRLASGRAAFFGAAAGGAGLVAKFTPLGPKMYPKPPTAAGTAPNANPSPARFAVDSNGVATDLQAPNSPAVRFGNNPNQTYHTFRHVEAAGMDQAAVQAAVQADIAANASAINAGLNARTITVGGRQITYNVFKLPDGVMNVGRITLP